MCLMKDWSSNSNWPCPQHRADHCCGVLRRQPRVHTDTQSNSGTASLRIIQTMELILPHNASVWVHLAPPRTLAVTCRPGKQSKWTKANGLSIVSCQPALLAAALVSRDLLWRKLQVSQYFTPPLAPNFLLRSTMAAVPLIIVLPTSTGGNHRGRAGQNSIETKTI